MADIKVVKTLTTANAMTFKVVNANPAHGLKTGDIDVSDLSNPIRKEKAPEPQLEETEISLQCEYAGVKAQVGVPGAVLEITVTLASGTVLSDSVTGYIREAIPVSIDVSGERRALQDVIFVPDGSNTTTTTT